MRQTLLSQLLLLPVLTLFAWIYVRTGPRRSGLAMAFDAAVILAGIAGSLGAAVWLQHWDIGTAAPIWRPVLSVVSTFHVFPLVLCAGWWLRRLCFGRGAWRGATPRQWHNPTSTGRTIREKTNMSDQPFATGRCLCGAVSYTIDSAPLRMACCHCKDCQRSSGTGHMPLAFFKEDDVHIQGATESYGATADSGNVNTRHFCPVCGSRVFSTNSARPGVVGIAVGCADDNGWFAPAVEIYMKHCEDWDRVAGEVARFDAMPPPPK